MFNKILVANRGEIAVRIIRACHELGIATVAIYSQADASALHVKLADQSVCIGPAPNRDSYLNIPNIVTAAIITGCDAVHPGYGNLSETVAFAENCDIARLKFIGPRPETIEKMQDKAQAKQLVARCRRAGDRRDGRHACSMKPKGLRMARQFGYPIMIKAAAGGGGRGIRIVHNEEEFIRNLPMAQAEAQASFGHPEVYLENYISEPRHIEVQMLADEHGQRHPSRRARLHHPESLPPETDRGIALHRHQPATAPADRRSRGECRARRWAMSTPAPWNFCSTAMGKSISWK